MSTNVKKYSIIIRNPVRVVTRISDFHYVLMKVIYIEGTPFFVMKHTATPKKVHKGHRCSC